MLLRMVIEGVGLKISRDTYANHAIKALLTIWNSARLKERHK